jgi:hypothetical protein
MHIYNYDNTQNMIEHRVLHCTQFPKKQVILRNTVPKESLSCNILYVIRTLSRFICIIRFLVNIFLILIIRFCYIFYMIYFSYVEQKLFPFPC